MNVLAKLALMMGGLVFCIVVFIVCLAFIDCLESTREKAVTDGQRRRSVT